MADHAVNASAGAHRRLGIELAIDFALMHQVMYTMIATIVRSQTREIAQIEALLAEHEGR